MEPGSEPSALFVYGTLRRGASMHALLEPDVRWLEPARYRGRLWDLGAFPGVTPGQGDDDVVHGDLLEIVGDAPGLLARVDRYEGRSFRRSVERVNGRSGRALRVWIYLYRGSLERGRRIHSGDFLGDSVRLSSAGPAARRA